MSYCMKCGCRDIKTIYDAETNETHKHLECRKCGNSWVEIDSLLTQWWKRRQGLIN